MATYYFIALLGQGDLSLVLPWCCLTFLKSVFCLFHCCTRYLSLSPSLSLITSLPPPCLPATSMIKNLPFPETYGQILMKLHLCEFYFFNIIKYTILKIISNNITLTMYAYSIWLSVLQSLFSINLLTQVLHSLPSSNWLFAKYLVNQIIIYFLKNKLNI
jgi:hypothetical protein